MPAALNLSSVPFWTPIVYNNPETLEQHLVNVVEDTFYLGGARAHVMGSCLQFQESPAPLLKIAIKIALLFFSQGRLLLVVAFVAKIVYRILIAQPEEKTDPVRKTQPTVPPPAPPSLLSRVLEQGEILKSKNLLSPTQVINMKIQAGSEVCKVFFSLTKTRELKIQQCIKTLGRGGFGKVYEIVDLKTRIHTALKMAIPPKGDKNSVDYQTKADADLEQEFNNLNLLNPHGTVTGIQSPPISPLLTMIKVDRSFRVRKKRKAFEGLKYDGSIDKLNVHELPPTERFKILFQIAKGAQHYRKLELVHSDLKPGNILYLQRKRDYLAHISDWGSVWSQKNSADGGTIYTPHYANRADLKEIQSSWTTAGKVWSGKKYDIYSLGVTFFELLTGKVFSSKVAIEHSLNSAGLQGVQYKKFTTILKRMVQPGADTVATAALDIIRPDKQGKPSIAEVVSAVEACV
jgi:hypothetical protein